MCGDIVLFTFLSKFNMIKYKIITASIISMETSYVLFICNPFFTINPNYQFQNLFRRQTFHRIEFMVHIIENCD